MNHTPAPKQLADGLPETETPLQILGVDHCCYDSIQQWTVSFLVGGCEYLYQQREFEGLWVWNEQQHQLNNLACADEFGVRGALVHLTGHDYITFQNLYRQWYADNQMVRQACYQ